MAETVIKKLTPKENLIAQLEKMGGIENNINALKKLQAAFTGVPKPEIEALRKATWRMK